VILKPKPLAKHHSNVTKGVPKGTILGLFSYHLMKYKG
jgi:hypothetical protein